MTRRMKASTETEVQSQVLDAWEPRNELWKGVWLAAIVVGMIRMSFMLIKFLKSGNWSPSQS